MTRNMILLVVAAAVVVVLLVVLAGSLYTVSEMEYVVVTQFGRPVRVVEEAGLRFKNPITQKAHRIEKRILDWDGYPTPVFTQDKKNIEVDTWARWGVVEPQQFYVSLGGRIDQGQSNLDAIVDGVVRDVIAKNTLNELVRSTDRELWFEEQSTSSEAEPRGKPPKVEIGREEIEREILSRAGKGLEEDFGIRLLDVRIKRVNYTPAVRSSIYARMKSERDRISSRELSEAEEQQSIILGDMAKELAAIEGAAKKEVSEIRGEADARAIDIYADAIRQAREFYEFQRTLEAYEKIFDRNTLVILSTDSQLLHLLKKDALLKKE